MHLLESLGDAKVADFDLDEILTLGDHQYILSLDIPVMHACPFMHVVHGAGYLEAGLHLLSVAHVPYVLQQIARLGQLSDNIAFVSFLVNSDELNDVWMEQVLLVLLLVVCLYFTQEGIETLRLLVLKYLDCHRRSIVISSMHFCMRSIANLGSKLELLEVIV